MCGIFGFAGSTPSAQVLVDTALAAGRRGPHSSGLAWDDRERGIVVSKRPGKIEHHLWTLAATALSSRVIGHCRLATSGEEPEDLADAHPHQVGDTAIVHNGVIREHMAIAARHGVTLATACDSELLAHLIDRATGSPKARVRRAIEAAVPKGPIALLAMVGGAVVAFRRELPIYVWRSGREAYFASTSFHVDAVYMPEDTVVAFAVAVTPAVRGSGTRRRKQSSLRPA